MVKEDSGNGWNEYQRLVLSELSYLRESVKEIQTSQNTQQIELALIKSKATLMGGISGSVTAALTIVGAYVKSRIWP